MGQLVFSKFKDELKCNAKTSIYYDFRGISILLKHLLYRSKSELGNVLKNACQFMVSRCSWMSSFSWPELSYVCLRSHLIYIDNNTMYSNINVGLQQTCLDMSAYNGFLCRLWLWGCNTCLNSSRVSDK